MIIFDQYLYNEWGHNYFSLYYVSQSLNIEPCDSGAVFLKSKGRINYSKSGSWMLFAKFVQMTKFATFEIHLMYIANRSVLLNKSPF